MISLIIVTYQSAATIDHCLNSVLAQREIEKEIIVVDNASTDATCEIVRRFSGVHLIESPTNVGFGAANQMGVNKAMGNILVFLNPDAAICDDFFSHVEKFFIQHPDVGILGCAIVDDNGNLQRTGNLFPTFFSLLYEHTALHRLFSNSASYKKFILADWDRRVSRVIDAVSGACFIMPRHTLQVIGGFDPEYFLYFEEYDLAQRVQKQGQIVFYEASLIVRHLGGASTNTMSDIDRQQIYNKSCRRYFQKYHGKFKATLLWTLITLLNIPKLLFRSR